MKSSTSTTSRHMDQGFPNLSGMQSLEQQEYEQWKSDPVAQKEYQQWLKQDEARRAKLPDPFTSEN